MSIQLNLIYGIVHKRFNKISKMKCTHANLSINYLTDLFSIEFIDKENKEGKKMNDKISNNSEMNEMLLERINSKNEIKIKTLHAITLQFNFLKKECNGEVFFINDQDEKEKFLLTNLM